MSISLPITSYKYNVIGAEEKNNKLKETVINRIKNKKEDRSTRISNKIKLFFTILRNIKKEIQTLFKCTKP